MIIDLDSWEAGYGDGYAAARLNARPVSTGFRIRAATSRLVQSCRDAGGHSAVLRSVINPASPSTARW